MDLESFELVVLRRPADATEYDEPTLDRIQAEHLRYLDSLREAGRVVTNGPVLDHHDESVRGLTLFRVGTLEEARRLAEDDPAVRAGRLVVDVMTWLCPAGTMILPGRPLEEGQSTG
ncbi:MAG TPA: YciI family protein [Gaiella sp.]|uniref:YciI family protein n=1 Tax=Gaiella sp. TaxID=2663207 RepID=UPI002D7F807C|nr:YciI family protein [Gaiella sp.]HET9287577.1 YciI family protein [Gaiella sp.]